VKFEEIFSGNRFFMYNMHISQTKAEREISKAQKLIWEKDAELLAAEESRHFLMCYQYRIR
jgi:hypothetical protein